MKNWSKDIFTRIILSTGRFFFLDLGGHAAPSACQCRADPWPGARATSDDSAQLAAGVGVAVVFEVVVSPGWDGWDQPGCEGGGWAKRAVTRAGSRQQAAGGGGTQPARLMGGGTDGRGVDWQACPHPGRQPSNWGLWKDSTVCHGEATLAQFQAAGPEPREPFEIRVGVTRWLRYRPRLLAGATHVQVQ